jgi:crotonobetainyl-CoA:carnitine CoA-transferase CaiB-like acyl-CoA transferase
VVEVRHIAGRSDHGGTRAHRASPRLNAPAAATRGPLDGLLVVDLSRILAGPYCTMTLGDLGARVIKVERPGTGDDTRAWGPPFWNGISTYYLAINRNKESLTLDLEHAEGRRLLAALVVRADVLVENFRPGRLERWGFGYDACAALNPRLIYASVSGYGLDGPDRDRAGYDLIAQGEGGVMSVTGEEGTPPLKTGVSQADIVAGLWLTSGILAALHARNTSGRGQRVDTSLLDGQIGLLAYHATNTWATGEAPARQGNRHSNLMPYGAWHCRDAWITLGAGNDALFAALCAALGGPLAGLAADPRFATAPARVTHRAALDEALTRALGGLAADDALARLRAAGVPSGRVRSVPEALADPQVAGRGMVVPLAHPSIPGFRTTGTPVRLSATPAAPRSAPPALGAHTGRVLAELGCDAATIARLRAAGAA